MCAAVSQSKYEFSGKKIKEGRKRRKEKK